MLYIDQFVYSNNLRYSHPIERFIFAIISLALSIMFSNPWVHFLLIVIMLGLLVFKANIPTFAVIKLMLLPISFLLIGVITIAVLVNTNDASMLTSIKVGNYYLGVSNNSLNLAIMTIFKSLSAVSCLYFLALTTPMIELIYVLQLFRVPNIVAELMMLIYRFIFVFVETAISIYTAQSSRGGHFNFKRSMYSFGLLFANLWGKAFLKSQALFTSLQSRGYDGKLNVLNPHYKISVYNILLFTTIDISLIALALCLGN